VIPFFIGKDARGKQEPQVRRSFPSRRPSPMRASTWNPWRRPEKDEGWYSPNLFIHNEAISVPAGPGFGIDYDPQYLAAAQRVTNCS
jgi:hypothetical protein